MEKMFIQTEVGEILVKLAEHPCQRRVDHAAVTIVLCHVAMIAKEPHLFENLSSDVLALTCDLLTICSPGLVNGNCMPEMSNV
jgi:hypothetical protein